MVKQDLLSKFINDFKAQYPNKAIPSYIDDELKQHADGEMTLKMFMAELRKKKSEWGPPTTVSPPAVSPPAVSPPAVSTYMFPWLYNLSTSTLIMIRDEINRMLVNK